MLQQLWSFHPHHWNCAVRYHPFCKSATLVWCYEQEECLTLFTVLPLQKHQTLVDEYVWYQSKEDVLFTESPFLLRETPAARCIGLCFQPVLGTAAACGPLPDPCFCGREWARVGHLVNEDRFGLGYLFKNIYIFWLAWQTHTWWICASTRSSHCHPLFVC